MDPQTLLDSRRSGLGKLLGITFPVASPGRVVARLELETTHLDPHGAVHSAIVMALADGANAYGAALNLAAGQTTTTIESKTHFLGTGTGTVLRAEASPLHVGPSVSVWRAAVFRDDVAIADV